MITKNIDGNNISAGFVSALTSDNTEYQARLLDGSTVLDCAITRLTITKGSCGSEEAFTIGNVVGSTLVAEVKGLATSVKGKELAVQIGVNVGGAFEYVNLGYFTVSETQQTAYATTITAYGATITKTGDVFTVPTTQTLANIASSIATTVSALAGRTITVTFDSGITTSQSITASMNNLTAYQALQILASVVGGYVIDTYDGNIKICRFSDTATLARDTATMRNLPVVDEQNFAVTGVLCIVTEASEDGEGQVVPAVQFPATPTGNENLVVKNPYMTQELYTSYLATLVGYDYRPASVGLTYGDPRLEGNDVLQVTDVNSNVYIIPCHMVTHKFDGGFTTQVVSVTATPQQNEVATSAGNLTEQLSSISANTISARASAESAKASAESAQASATRAEGLADQAYDLAESVYGLAQQASADAQSASESANEAQQSATSASVSASTALTQLSVVEDIIGVLDLISQNGEYEKTLDTEAQPNKWYFTRTGSGTTADPYVYEVVASPQFEYVLTSDVAIVQGKPYYTRTGSGTEADPYSYILVENPVVADIGTYYENTGWNYYQLVGIDQAIQNYVSSHIALSGNSLYLQNGATRVELSTTNGMILYNESGNPVAQYGADTIIGNINQFGIKIGESPESTQQTPIYELGFYQDGNRVAYINNNSLYITQTVVLRQMQMGDSLGIWAWCIHEVNAKNNLYLKWLG